MNFIQIFEEEGLYTTEEFRDGVAIKIEKDLVNKHYMKLVHFENSEQLRPMVYDDYPLSQAMVNYDYKKVFTRNQLFGKKKEELLNE